MHPKVISEINVRKCIVNFELSVILVGFSDIELILSVSFTLLIILFLSFNSSLHFGHLPNRLAVPKIASDMI